jgi:hypothetical protein
MPRPHGRGVRVLRRAYALLRQGVACAEVSEGGPVEWRGRVPGQPSWRSRRIVSPRIERPRAPKGLWFTVPEAEMHELISNRGASAKIRTARRPRNAEVSGDESRREPCSGSRGSSLPQLREDILGTVPRTVRTLHRTPSGPLAAKVSRKERTCSAHPC